MSQPSSAPFYILIVEDADEFAAVARRILSRMGVTSYHANDGNKAIAFLEQYKPDLILLDLHLGAGEITGWNVLEFAAKTYGEQAIPVIVTTAYTDPANRIVGKLQYISDYLVKPFTAQQLMDAVNKVRYPQSEGDHG